MKKLIILIMMVFYPLLTLGANMAAVTGKIIYGSGDFLISLDLSNSKEVVLKKLIMASFSGLTKIDADRILLTTYYGPMTEKLSPSIMEYNLKTSQMTKLFPNAAYPVFLPESKKLLFYYVGGHSKQDDGIYSLDYRQLEKKPKRVASLSDVDFGDSLIPVSKTEVVFSSTKINDRGKILIYNVDTHKVRSTFLRNCDSPFIWRSKTKQLLCRTGGGKYKYFLTSLDGEVVQNMDFFDGNDDMIRPVLYLPQYDKLLFVVNGARNFSEYYDLWIYDFATGEKHRILKDDAIMGNGDVVYYEN
ncbi:MAG: hypothetical protein WCW01_06540 [Gammaproteobacteria bacterium]